MTDMNMKLAADEFMKTILPAVVRLAVEVGERHATLDENCPVLALAEKLIGLHPARAETVDRAAQDQAIHLAQLMRLALEKADEVFQLDGPAAIGFAAGFLAGEVSSTPLFSSEENLAADQAAAAAVEADIPICTPVLHHRPAAVAYESFRAGFTSRRDWLRKSHRTI